MAHAFWKGSISFGLVEIPVSLQPALQSDDLSFTLLNPSFRGLREDKAAKDVVREVPSSPSAASRPSSRGAGSRPSSRSAPKKMPPVRRRPPDTPTRRPPPVRDPNPKPPVEDPPQKPRKKPMRDPVDQGVAAALTHPDRVLYPESDLTKLDLARYLHRVAEPLLLHAAGRPLIAPYSPRARAGAPVSMPIEWEDLSTRLSPAAFSIPSVLERARLARDPWAGIGRVAQTLSLSRIRAAARARP